MQDRMLFLPHRIRHDPSLQGSVTQSADRRWRCGRARPKDRKRRNDCYTHPTIRLAHSGANHCDKFMRVQSSTSARRLGQIEGHIGSKTLAWRLVVTNARTRSEELWSLAQEAGRFGISEWEVQTGRLRLSPSFISIYGLDKVDLTHEEWLKCIFREDISRYLDLVDN